MLYDKIYSFWCYTCYRQQLVQTNTKASHEWLYDERPIIDGGFFSQKYSHAENVSMTCHYHVLRNVHEIYQTLHYFCMACLCPRRASRVDFKRDYSLQESESIKGTWNSISWTVYVLIIIISGKSVCCKFETKHPHWAQFCLCHDSAAVVACAQLSQTNHIFSRKKQHVFLFFTRFGSWSHKMLVKWIAEGRQYVRKVVIRDSIQYAQCIQSGCWFIK